MARSEREKASPGARTARWRVTAAVVLCAAGCSPARRQSLAPVPPASVAATVPTSIGPTTTLERGCAQQVLASMTEAERVGQLFMIGVPLAAPDAAALATVRADAVGGVILHGDSRAPVSAVRALTDHIRAVDATAVAGAGLYVATDQEGGQVQELSGPGFSAIPSAVTQGTIGPTQLQADAERWGAQLAAAGVNVDLAPVFDTVPPDDLAVNQPIAHFQRELGTAPATVASHGVALVRGLQSAGVGATVKHFPGLGRVVGDTDTTAGVVDSVTTRHDPWLAPYGAGVKAGADFVMISLATYAQIDPAHRAVFSPLVIGGMVRGDLGFRGLVISDDLGQAKEVLAVSPGQRAISFLAAGGDIVLVVNPPSVAAAMVAAVRAQVAASPSFRAVVDAAALALVTAKQAAGLLTCP